MPTVTKTFTYTGTVQEVTIPPGKAVRFKPGKDLQAL